MQPDNTEENYPLLLLLLDDGNAPKKNKRVLFDKNRYSKITEGASHVLTQLPGQVSTSWATFFLILMFLLMLLLFFMATTIHPLPLSPHCRPYTMNESDVKIYLVHEDGPWQKGELAGLEDIVANYPGLSVDLLIVSNDRIRRRHRWRRRRRVLGMNINVGKKSVLNTVNVTAAPEEPVLQIADVLARFPVVSLKNKTAKEWFALTPLHPHWRRLRPDLMHFALRVVMLWEYGGISFKLPKKEVAKVRVYDKEYDQNWKIEEFIRSNLTSYRELPSGVVNIDDEGLHMETKTPCHAYFGEVLRNLRRAGRNSTVRSLVVDTLRSFCLSGAVSDEYCFNFSTM